jgi:hypothetical protein
MSGEPKRYSPEFKEQAAKKVIDNSLPIAQVARELGVNDTTLGFWVKAYRKRIAGDPLPPGMPGLRTKYFRCSSSVFGAGGGGCRVCPSPCRVGASVWQAGGNAGTRGLVTDRDLGAAGAGWPTVTDRD